MSGGPAKLAAASVPAGPSSIKLENKGDLSFLSKQAEVRTPVLRPRGPGKHRSCLVAIRFRPSQSAVGFQRALRSLAVAQPGMLHGSRPTEVLEEEEDPGTARGPCLSTDSLLRLCRVLFHFPQNLKTQQKPHPVKHLLHTTKRESKRKGSFKSEKIIRQLLGELYVDKEYLEKLLLDEGFGLFVGSGDLGQRSGVDAEHASQRPSLSSDFSSM